MREDQHQPANDRPRSGTPREPIRPPVELVEPGDGDPYAGYTPGPGHERYAGTPFTRALFGGRQFAGGRVRVYGCSPGCLIASLIVSLILTLLLNAIF